MISDEPTTRPGLRLAPGFGLRALLGRCLRRRAPRPVAPVPPPPPHLTVDAEGRPRCVACALCAAACPTDCIRIEAGPAPWRPDADRARTALRFDLDLARCLRCGLCVAACPEEAIVLGGAAPVPVAAARQALRLDREALLERP